MPPIDIRPATFGDLPGIRDIYNDAVLTTTATYDEQPETLGDRLRWFEKHLAADLPVFVAVERRRKPRVVGWSAVSEFRSRIGYRFTVENSVYVAADRRGQGLGARLLAALIDATRQRGYHAIVAGIDSDSQASIRLHAAFGFVEVARFREVGYKFGRWLDVVFMELLLQQTANRAGGSDARPDTEGANA
jgi:phosphinothricin acetyltransferase